MKTRLRLLYSFFVVCTLLITCSAYSQITYSANFDDDDSGWDLIEFYSETLTPCQGDGTLLTNLYEDVPVSAAFSPMIGTSNGGVVTLTYSYSIMEFDIPPTEATQNEDNWGFMDVYWATSPEGPYNLIETIDPDNHTESTSCAQRTVTFQPPVGTPVYLAVYAELGDVTNDFIIFFDEVNATQAASVACDGTPDAATTIAQRPALCNGQSATLSLAPGFFETGLTVQWQTSADNVTYTNAPTGGTGITYTAAQTATTWYRAVITCTASSQSVNSAPVRVISTGQACPCDIVFDGMVEPITLVNFAGINNASSATVIDLDDDPNAPVLQDFTGLTPGEVEPGESYTITLRGNTNDDFFTYIDYFTVFIDWNHDGDFSDTNERYEVEDPIEGSTGTDGQQVTESIAVPANALPGYTYMRVVKNWYDEEGPEYGEACGDGNSGFGQAEDYLLHVSTSATIGWANLQHPATMSLVAGNTGTVYARVWSDGVTNGPGAGAGITAWIGISPVGSNTDPNTWTTWIPATYNAAATNTGNNDEYMATIGAGLAPGTYYYASRFQIDGGAYSYGGITPATPDGGGFWNGTSNISGVLTVTCGTAAPDADGTQTFCAGSTVADLEAEGDTITWYTANTGGTVITGNTALVDGTIYYASVTPAGGCESITRTAVTVDLTVTPAPDADAEQTLCHGSTVADLEADGETITWYTAATGGTVVSENTVLTDNTIYYASVTVDGCESVSRTGVTAQITVVEAPETEQSTQTFCNEADLDDLDVEADGDIVWYAAETGGTPLNEDTEVTTGNTYYAAQIVDGCESSGRTAITVEITTTALPSGDQTQEIAVANANDATIEDIEITATGTVTWYATEEDAEDGENSLAAGTVLTDGSTYYATQTIDDCESLGFGVTVDVTLGNNEFSAASFRYHPNPVNDILTLSYDNNISAIEVYNIVGQKVIAKTVNQTLAQVDMSQLAAGTYMVKVMSDTASKTIKVVKQ